MALVDHAQSVPDGRHALAILIFMAQFFIAGLYVAVQEALEPTVTAEMVRSETLAITFLHV